MDKSLAEFYNNKYMRKAVQDYFTSFLREHAIEKVFSKEDTSAIAEAKEILDKGFENLETMFEPKAKTNTKNEAR